MIRTKHLFMNGDGFDIEMNPNGVVQVSFGATHVCMNLEAAMDLRHLLAKFLTEIEVNEAARPVHTPSNVVLLPARKQH
ncbi:MAG: hypothetical protein JNL01_14450 [Bdellovibrionales bacterium]|nr:hypothetical protein [Bdellovibrionales bacterium]